MFTSKSNIFEIEQANRAQILISKIGRGYIARKYLQIKFELKNIYYNTMIKRIQKVARIYINKIENNNSKMLAHTLSIHIVQSFFRKLVYDRKTKLKMNILVLRRVNEQNSAG